MRRMKHLKRFGPFVVGAAALFLSADPASAESPKPPSVPAHFEVEVDPASVAPGGEARVVVQLTPVDGVKINRYPRIRLKVPATEGVVAAAEGSIGNDKAPPPGKMDTNYYKKVDPVEVTLSIDPSATAGTHEIPAKLTYYYCVTASGFCAPKTVPIEFALRVE